MTNNDSCRNECKRKFKAGSIKYADGARWCTHCGAYVKWEGRYCPCCGKLLRTQSYDMRYSKNKPEVARVA